MNRNKQLILKTDEHGTKRWLLNNKYHREDGPAIEYPDGRKEWYVDGRLHRVNGPAIECFRNTLFQYEYWYQDGLLHREDGPAYTNNDNDKEWYIEGKYHRTDGPAIEWSDGFKEWWIDDNRYSQEEWFQQLTSEQQDNYLWNLNNE